MENHRDFWNEFYMSGSVVSYLFYKEQQRRFMDSANKEHSTKLN